MRASSGIALASVRASAAVELRASDRLRASASWSAVLGLGDLRLEVGRLGALRRDEGEPADENDGEHADRCDDESSPVRKPIEHHLPPMEPRFAPIVNCTAMPPVPVSARVLLCSETSLSQGRAESRSMTRATARCELVTPVTVNAVGVAPDVAGVVEAAAVEVETVGVGD